jgi:predicted metalloprotease
MVCFKFALTVSGTMPRKVKNDSGFKNNSRQSCSAVIVAVTCSYNKNKTRERKKNRDEKEQKETQSVRVGREGLLWCTCVCGAVLAMVDISFPLQPQQTAANRSKPQQTAANSTQSQTNKKTKRQDSKQREQKKQDLENTTNKSTDELT